MQGKGVLLGAVMVDIVYIQTAIIDGSGEKAGVRVSAVYARHTGGFGNEVNRAGLVSVLAPDLLQVAEFAAELDGVRAMYRCN